MAPSSDAPIKADLGIAGDEGDVGLYPLGRVPACALRLLGAHLPQGH